MTWFFNCESELNAINKYFSRVQGRRGCESVLEAPAEAAKAASAFVRINTFTGATAFKVFWL
jgi:hypothetical protein